MKKYVIYFSQFLLLTLLMVWIAFGYKPRTVDIEIGGEPTFLNKGWYTLVVEYNSDYDQVLNISTDEYNVPFLKAGAIRLNRTEQMATYDFVVEQGIDNFSIRIQENEQGETEIYSSRLYTNNHLFRILWVILALLSIIVDVVLRYREWFLERKNVLFAITCITILASLPLMMPGILAGHDFSYHILRIEALAEELKCGHFPIRISSLYLQGSGYASSVYYNDLFLYIPAILRLIGFPVICAYKIYIVLVNLVTASLAYWSFVKIFDNRKTGLILSLVYVTSSYRMIDIYVRSAVGEYSALMFLPLVAAGLYMIYEDKKRGETVLALGISGFVGTHILSTEMLVIALFIVCMLLFKRTFKLAFLKRIALAAVETILLNLYFIVPFVDYYLNVNANINATVSGSSLRIQNRGAYLAQYFAFFQNEYGISGTNVTERMMLSPGPILVVALGVSVLWWINGKASRKMKLYTICAGIFMLLSSNLFPWDEAAKLTTAGKLMASVQFPWRYLGISIIFLCLILGEELNCVDSQSVGYIIVGICILMCSYFTSNYIDDAGKNNAGFVYYQDTLELNTYDIGNAEYLPTDAKRYEPVAADFSSLDLCKMNKQGTTLTLQCKSTNGGMVQFPYTNYKGYHVYDQNGKEYEIINGEFAAVTIIAPRGFDGEFTVKFVEPWYWRMAEIASIGMSLALLLKQRKEMGK